MQGRELFLNSFDPVILLDTSTLRIVDANPAFLKFTGKRTEWATGRSVLDWIAPADREGFTEALRAGSAWEELWKMNAGSAALVMMTSFIVRDGDRELLQLIIRDHRESHERGIPHAASRHIDELHRIRQKLEMLTSSREINGPVGQTQLMKLLTSEHSRATASREVYSILTISIDDYDAYARQNGIKAAENLMRQISMIAGTTARPSDVSGRPSADKWLLICAKASQAEALAIADAIRRAVEIRPMLYGSSQPLGRITVSIGVAHYSGQKMPASAVLETSNTALSRAQAKGKNRVEAASLIPSESKRGALSLFRR